MEALGGVRAHMVSRTSVCLEFLQIHVFDDVNLQLLLEFNNTDGKTVLMSAKVGYVECDKLEASGSLRERDVAPW